MTSDNQTPDVYEREKLYEEVWAEPVKLVAERYGVSDVALAKTCRKMAIPLPGRGYWAKVKAGMKPPTTPLAVLPKDARAVLPVRSGGPHLRGTAGDKVSKARPAIAVAPVLTDPHPLVAQAANALSDRKPNKDGILPRPRRRCLDVLVSPAALDRALRVMDALLKALEADGVTLEVTAPKEEDAPNHHWTRSTTRALMAGEWIEFGIAEEFDVLRAAAPEPPKHLKEWQRDYWIRDHTPDPEYVPNSRLALLIKTGEGLGVRRTWRDGKRQRMENCLASVLAHMELTAEAITDKRERDERRRREWAEREKRREEERQRRWKEERRVKELEGYLDRWRRARDVRTFVSETRERAKDLPEDRRLLLEKRLVWALSYADRVDPIPDLMCTPDQTEKA